MDDLGASRLHGRCSSLCTKACPAFPDNICWSCSGAGPAPWIKAPGCRNTKLPPGKGTDILWELIVVSVYLCSCVDHLNQGIAKSSKVSCIIACSSTPGLLLKEEDCVSFHLPTSQLAIQHVSWGTISTWEMSYLKLPVRSLCRGAGAFRQSLDLAHGKFGD